MKEEYKERMARMRARMEAHGVDAAIVPQTDPHQSEYLADHWEVRRYLSGFTGSAGTLVLTHDDARMWVDSRYFLQSASQLEGTGIGIMKIAIPGTPSIEEWITATLKAGDTVGIDTALFPASSVDEMKVAFSAKGINLTHFDEVDAVWTDRPALPKCPVTLHDEKYAGESAKDKIAAALQKASEAGARNALISALDEIAWTLNIRSRDVEFNPVATSYLYLTPDGSVLFVDEDKIPSDVKAYLKDSGVTTAPYLSVREYLSANVDAPVLVEMAKTSAMIRDVLGEHAVSGASPVAVAKACRNDVQIAGIRQAMVRDGVALVKAMMEIESRVASEEGITEVGVAEVLHRHRSAQPLYMDESFGTIAGYGPHGAIVHYEADAESDVAIEPHGLLLIDSGAQYLDGTTDITRTFSMGAPTEREKHDFTLVLKGHIALAQMVFPVGTLGVQIDCEARKFLWREGYTYLHGTGHGVGHFLNVHEGPQTIRMNPTPVPLMEGMVTSNEPGLYIEGLHGIRSENLMLCVRAMSTEFGDFLKFETITLFPFDLTLMQTEIMSAEEIDWINEYHAEVYAKLSPYLNEEECVWLAEKTRRI